VNVDSVLKLKDALENRNIDGDWLFEESFSEQNLERYYGVSKKAQIEQKEAIDQCGRLRQKLIKKIGFDPSRYFAVIVLDGDGMGQTISQAEDWEAHTAISSKLNEYTTKVRQIVDGDYLGKLIYAGGDDVLALANLGDLLKILCRLRWDFPNLNGQENPASTASAGVCIAHCKVPLGEVLSRARVMERAAKSVDGKNALGIALLKHSGNISRTVFKWEYKVENAKHIDMITVSRNLVELIKKGEVSKRFMYAFRDVFTRLTDRDGLLELPGIIESELERLIRRATSEKVLSDAEIQQRIDKNVQDLTTMLANKLIKFDDFISFLEIINFIAREGKTDETVSETE
jgi:CRISPR-associated protein Cmr2